MSRLVARVTDSTGQFAERGFDVPIISPPPLGARRASDIQTWRDLGLGGFPTQTTRVVVPSGFALLYDTDDLAIGHVINRGRWIWADGAKRLRMFGNFISEGDLEAGVAQAPQVGGLLQFLGIDESRFVGGGMDPVESDIGLWVTGAGRLLLHGTPRAHMVRAVADLLAQQQSFPVDADMTGWSVGDVLGIAPMNLPPFDRNRPDYGYLSESGVVQSISGRTVALEQPLQFNHRGVEVDGVVQRPEIVNLTRSFRIEGTERGKTHIFVRSTRPHDILDVGTRWLGPRKVQPFDPVNDPTGPSGLIGILGRWGGFHFHHCGEGSVGTIVEGTVDRDSGGHSLVPHVSHGITYRRTVSYDCFDDPIWWDLGHQTFRTVFEDPLVFNAFSYPGFSSQAGRLSAYNLGVADHRPEFEEVNKNTVIRPVAIGVRGGANASGITWPETPTNLPPASDRFPSSLLWGYVGPGVFHHCPEGIFNWQNNDHPHVIDGAIIYCTSGPAVDHGAYGNRFLMRNIRSAWCAVHRDLGPVRATIINHAASSGVPIIYDDHRHDGQGIVESGFLSVPGNNDDTTHTLLLRMAFRRYAHSAFRIYRDPGLPTADHRIRMLLVREGVVEATLHTYWLDDGIRPESEIRVESITIDGRQEGGYVLRPNVSQNPGVFRPEWNARVQAL